MRALTWNVRHIPVPTQKYSHRTTTTSKRHPRPYDKTTCINVTIFAKPVSGVNAAQPYLFHSSIINVSAIQVD